jgi:hypothetical protein
VNAYVFETELIDEPGVSRRLLVGGDPTLVALHELLRRAFGWDDDHLYSFWLDGEFWGDPETEYTSPVEPEPGAKTAEVELERLGLETGQEIAYVFDFGDEWRVRLRMDEIRPAANETAVVLEIRGQAPPQYAIPDDEELGTGD